MDHSVLNVLVCPIGKANLYYDKETQVLVCKADKLAYPIRENIPLMLVEEAKKMTLEEVKKYG
ncbi:Trm112 family protein [Francisella tularensis subsp. holarctica]|uniref:Trm112 family protein n=1 Tax=Francisella tularensis TaxID=263 RepID=UPI002381C4DB|nr:Trm112 family protein [Francisella tularensis]MDE4996927.1 Trm112 family protein [Francisella tularensis subsp. holarctica]